MRHKERQNWILDGSYRKERVEVHRLSFFGRIGGIMYNSLEHILNLSPGHGIPWPQAMTRAILEARDEEKFTS